MDKQVLTRRALFVLGLAAVTGQAMGNDGAEGPRPHHRGYKVGAGLVVIAIAAALGSRLAFNEWRQQLASRRSTAPVPPTPLPDASDWDGHEGNEAEADPTPTPSLRQRRTRRKSSVVTPDPDA